MNMLLLLGCSGSPSSPEPVPAPAASPAAPAPAAPVAPPVAPAPAAPADTHGGPTMGTIPPGASGVIMAIGTDLQVIIPASEVPGFDPKAVPAEGATWLSHDDMTVFGAGGVQAQMPPPSFSVIRWCHDQYRLEGRVVMPTAPPREVMLVPDKRVLSFVRVGSGNVGPAPATPGALASGDSDKDGTPEAYLTDKLELVTARGKSPTTCDPKQGAH